VNNFLYTADSGVLLWEVGALRDSQREDDIIIIIIIITFRGPAPWRKCNATGAGDDDDVGVGQY
jgi:hypothetical protein